MQQQKYTLDRCKLMFEAIVRPRWRVWKLIDEAGLCMQAKSLITSPKKLLQFIESCSNANPQALYVSVSTFLNPNKNHGDFMNQRREYSGYYFYPRKGYTTADCIMLDSYFFTDVDDKDITVVQEDARKIVQYMDTKPEYELKILQWSGTKGMHIGYEDTQMMKIADVTKRIKHYKKEKQRLTGELLSLGLKTMDNNHSKIMQDCFRVYAVPHSYKPAGGIVTPMTKHELLYTDTLIGFNHNKTREAVPSANDTKVAHAKVNALAPQQYRIGKRASLSFQSTFFRFVDNRVKGLKGNFVTVIKTHKKRFNMKMLKQIQKVYHLSDFYIYNSGDYMYAYNFKLVQYKRLVKILRKANAANLSYFITRRHTPIQISETRNQEGDYIDQFKYIKTLESDYGNYHMHSKPHCGLFKVNYPSMAGTEVKHLRQGTMKVVA